VKGEAVVLRVATTLVALFAAAACAMSASAGSAVQSPLGLVLQRSDFPPNTKWSSARSPSLEQKLAAAGLQGKAGSYDAEIVRGSTEVLMVSGLVIVLPNAAQARRAFTSYKNPFPATPRDIVRLPALYGDEQVAIVTRDPSVRADLRVRKGAVVWRLEIKWSGTDKFTRARALAELKTYAAKQKRRVAR
jgi:hypothetical protein